MPNFSTQERRAAILRLIDRQNSVSVSELSRMFGISEVSIRKDLKTMQRANLLMRNRGGAMRIPVADDASDMPLDTKIYENIREKSGIGKLAASMIYDGDTVMLDSGTTTLEIAKNLKWFNRLTIVTNAINIALEIQKYNRFNTILLGGHIRNTSLSVVGPVAEQNVRSFYCDKLFLGVDSFSMTDGISTPNIEEANLNRTMMSMAREVIAVFDHTKCYKRNFVHICMPNELDAIVSDRKFPGKLKAELQGMGVDVHIANLEE